MKRDLFYNEIHTWQKVEIELEAGNEYENGDE